ncbi:MAG TPA: MFS transporter, partial [Kiritimatiellia bacterium]|nr:MFS transporter [Kiritimatiellia bacterium]
MSTGRRPGYRLMDYFVVEGLNSFACTLLLLSLFFWTKGRFGFGELENLLLGVAQGVVYIGSARLGGRWSDRLGYDRMLMVGVGGTGVVALGGWLLPGPWGPFVLIGTFMFFMGLTWPALEAVVMHVGSPMSAPRRLGIYNMVWSATGALGFFASGWLFGWRPDAVIWGAGVVFMVELVWLGVRRGGGRACDVAGGGPEPHVGERPPRG